MPLVNFDVKAFVESWRKMQDKMEAAGGNAWEQVLKQAWASQKEFGYQNKTGRLTSSMQKRSWQRGKFGWRGELKTTAPYALFVDGGTKPHKIAAKNVEFLRFYWPRVGKWVAFKSVNHPGTRPAAFRAAAIQRFGQTAPAVIEQAMADAAK